MNTYIHTNIHLFIHTYIHTYYTHTHTYIYTYTHAYIHTYIYKYTHEYIHTYKYTFIHSFIYTYIHAYIHTCIHTYIHTYIYTYIHTYIHTHTHTHIHTYRDWNFLFARPWFKICSIDSQVSSRHAGIWTVLAPLLTMFTITTMSEISKVGLFPLSVVAVHSLCNFMSLSFTSVHFEQTQASHFENVTY